MYQGIQPTAEHQATVEIAMSCFFFLRGERALTRTHMYMSRVQFSRIPIKYGENIPLWQRTKSNALSAFEWSLLIIQMLQHHLVSDKLATELTKLLS